MNWVLCFLVFAESFGILSAMNLEEEVFKIGKQLEKIVGQEGAVSRTFVVECHSICRPVSQRVE